MSLPPHQLSTASRMSGKGWTLWAPSLFRIECQPAQFSKGGVMATFHHVDKTVLSLTILLQPPPQCWDHRHVPSCLTLCTHSTLTWHLNILILYFLLKLPLCWSSAELSVIKMHLVFKELYQLLFSLPGRSNLRKEGLVAFCFYVGEHTCYGTFV